MKRQAISLLLALAWVPIAWPCAGHGGHTLTYEPLPSITPPNRAHVSPVHFCNCMARIGWKFVGLVLTLMPGSSTGSYASCRLAACFMILAREKSPSHCFSTCSITMLTP